MKVGYLAAFTLSLAFGAAAHAGETTPEQLVDALNGVFGKPQGTKSSHAKGVCAAGVFKGAEGAAAVTKAGAFDGKEHPVTIRFSIGGGNPKVSDKTKGPSRGLAASIDAPDGATEFVLVSAPVHFAKTPAQMVEFLKVRAPDPATGKADPEKVKAFAAANPETTRQGAYISGRPVAASYVDMPYFGVNTFHFTNKDGKRVSGRWIVRPVAGEVGLTEEELKAKSDNFYAEELPARLKAKPAAFDFLLQLPEPGDDLLNPTVAWPDDRKTVPMGRLTVTEALSGDKADECQKAIFNPIILADGIEPSDDPILQARAAAYAVSHARRTP
ncbi:MAG: catalase family peroxidase [Hyphomicrobiales bacterium]|nr:catalase family peroxidase [Hyphomicrobiales bacterium]